MFGTSSTFPRPAQAAVIVPGTAVAGSPNVIVKSIGCGPVTPASLTLTEAVVAPRGADPGKDSAPPLGNETPGVVVVTVPVVAFRVPVPTFLRVTLRRPVSPSSRTLSWSQELTASSNAAPTKTRSFPER